MMVKGIRISLLLPIHVTLCLVKGYESNDAAAPAPTTARSRMLVISLDGFRHDYLDHGLVNMQELASKGVRAKGMASCNISKTFPNHVSMVTGLYEETHGIVANTMFDPMWNETFDNCNSCNEWYEGEPIWQTNELKHRQKMSHLSVPSGPAMSSQGVVHQSGVIYWPGIGAHINNFTASYQVPYTDSTAEDWLTLRERIDLMTSWFEEGINLGMIYYEEPDWHGHHYGPESVEVNKVLEEIDDDIGYLTQKLQQRHMEDINVMIVSDHGLADIQGEIFLDECPGLNTEIFNVTDNDPVIFIWPHDEVDVDMIYNQLTACPGIVVHRKDSPDLIQYRYNSNRRVSPLVVISEFSEDGNSGKALKLTRPAHNQKGNHGWNSSWEKMQAIFIARGPVFKQGYIKNDTFDNVHLYPLMCHILELSCPPSNGSLSMISDTLLTRDSIYEDTAITHEYL